MKLSELVRRCKDNDPEVMVEGPDGVPVLARMETAAIIAGNEITKLVVLSVDEDDDEFCDDED